MASVNSVVGIFSGKKYSKTIFIIGGCALLGVSAYAAYYYYSRKNRNRLIDEGFEDLSIADDPEKRIVVLGLDGAGKSNFLAHLSKGSPPDSKCAPTDGCNAISLSTGYGKTLNFLEIGGSEGVRIYWNNFLEDTDVLVYVVDSADDHRLPESILELQKLAANEKLKKVPFVILANKQDLPNALPGEDIAEAFGAVELTRQRKVQVLPLQVPLSQAQAKSHESVQTAKNLIFELCSQK